LSSLWVGQAIVFCGLPTQTTKNDRLRHDHSRRSISATNSLSRSIVMPTLSQ
jgi:hypothetical protein